MQWCECTMYVGYRALCYIDKNSNGKPRESWFTQGTQVVGLIMGSSKGDISLFLSPFFIQMVNYNVLCK
mgnify:CR=1 FL=1